jgi:hypothetical protein
MTDRLTLAAALERFKAEAGGHLNSYEWYRQGAQRGERIWLGGTEIPAAKVGGQWTVQAADLERAVEAAHEARRTLERITADYDRHVLHGDDGATVHIAGGGYQRRGPFHFGWSDYLRGRMKSDGTWMCSTCWEPASLEHNKNECHTCSDWGSCRSDCTLSRVFCETCGTDLAV